MVVLLYELRRKKIGQLFAKDRIGRLVPGQASQNYKQRTQRRRMQPNALRASYRRLGAFARDAGIYERANLCTIGPRANKPGINVRFGSKADICSAKGHVRFTPNSDRESGFRKKSCPLYSRKRTCAVQLGMSALCHKRTFDLRNHLRG